MKSQGHVGSESFFIRKATSKKPNSKVDAYPFLSKNGQPSLSPSAVHQAPSKPSDFATKKTESRNAEILEEQFPEVFDAQQEMKKDPSNPVKHFILAQMYHSCRVYDLALEEYQKALELDHDNPGYHEGLARLWRDSGDFKNSIDSVHRAVQLDENNVEAWNTLGTVCDRLGKHIQAQHAYSRALSISPQLDYVHNNACSSFIRVEEYSKALPHCEQAVQLNPNFAVAQNNLGIVYGMLGDVAKAYEAFLRVSDEASAHNNVGWVLMRKSKLEEASEQFKIAAKLKPFYRLASQNYYLAESLRFKINGRAVGISSVDMKSRTQPKLATLDQLSLDLKLLPTALEHESVISILRGGREVDRIRPEILVGKL